MKLINGKKYLPYDTCTLRAGIVGFAVFIMLTVLNSCGNYMYLELSQIEAGELESRLGNRAGKVTDLKLDGQMNGTDVQYLCDLMATSDLLSSVDLSETNVKLTTRAIAGNQQLKTIVLPKGMEVVPSFCFSNCTKLENVTIPENCTVIGEQAFNKCEKIESLTLPESFIRLCKNSLKSCSGLKEIKSLSTTPPNCEPGCFDGIDTDHCVLIVPKGCASKYKNAVGWENFKVVKSLK